MRSDNSVNSVPPANSILYFRTETETETSKATRKLTTRVWFPLPIKRFMASKPLEDRTRAMRAKSAA
jgi:hypothetical protein